MEAFFMMTAMIALLGPMAIGRVRCISVTARLPRLQFLVLASILPGVFRAVSVALAAGKLSSDADQICARPGSAALPARGTTALRLRQSAVRRYADAKSLVKAWVNRAVRATSIQRELRV